MSSFHVERSIQIAASPEQVFDKIADFNTWTTWSPWLLAEPDAEVTVRGKSNAVGGVYAWRGDVVGAGEIEHRRLERPHKIEDEIRFSKPFRSTSQVRFEVQPVGTGSKLTWHMHGSLPWFMFWMKPMMQTFIGMDYDRGLRMLKEWIETGRIQSQTTLKGVVPVGPLHMLGVRDKCPVADVGPSIQAAFSKAAQELKRHNLPADQGMISVYHRFDMRAGTFDYTSGYLVPETALSQAGVLSAWSLPAVQAFCVEHVGSYEHLGNAWSVANQIARHKKLKQCKLGTFELYKSTPPETPPANARTEIYLPLR